MILDNIIFRLLCQITKIMGLKMKAYKIVVLLVIVLINFMTATEKKNPKDIDIDALTTELQATLKGVDQNHFALVWWMPYEYWDAVFTQDPSINETDKNDMLDVLKEVTLMAVVQADVSTFGAFKFYSIDEVKKRIRLSFSDQNSKKYDLELLEEIDPDLSIILSVFKPILSSAMGNLGQNMHFMVINDKTSDGHRIIDPYNSGIFSINLEDKSGNVFKAEIETPLNSLFIPRKCPNGKDAHISWKYCPWTGEKLEE